MLSHMLENQTMCGLSNCTHPSCWNVQRRIMRGVPIFESKPHLPDRSDLPPQKTIEIPTQKITNLNDALSLSIPAISASVLGRIPNPARATIASTTKKCDKKNAANQHYQQTTMRESGGTPSLKSANQQLQIELLANTPENLSVPLNMYNCHLQNKSSSRSLTKHDCVDSNSLSPRTPNKMIPLTTVDTGGAAAGGAGGMGLKIKTVQAHELLDASELNELRQRAPLKQYEKPHAPSAYVWVKTTAPPTRKLDDAKAVSSSLTQNLQNTKALPLKKELMKDISSTPMLQLAPVSPNMMSPSGTMKATTHSTTTPHRKKSKVTMRSSSTSISPKLADQPHPSTKSFSLNKHALNNENLTEHDQRNVSPAQILNNNSPNQMILSNMNMTSSSELADLLDKLESGEKLSPSEYLNLIQMNKTVSPQAALVQIENQIAQHEKTNYPQHSQKVLHQIWPPQSDQGKFLTNLLIQSKAPLHESSERKLDLKFPIPGQVPVFNMVADQQSSSSNTSMLPALKSAFKANDSPLPPLNIPPYNTPATANMRFRSEVNTAAGASSRNTILSREHQIPCAPPQTSENTDVAIQCDDNANPINQNISAGGDEGKIETSATGLDKQYVRFLSDDHLAGGATAGISASGRPWAVLSRVSVVLDEDSNSQAAASRSNEDFTLHANYFPDSRKLNAVMAPVSDDFEKYSRVGSGSADVGDCVDEFQRAALQSQTPQSSQRTNDMSGSLYVNLDSDRTNSLKNYCANANVYDKEKQHREIFITNSNGQMINAAAKSVTSEPRRFAKELEWCRKIHDLNWSDAKLSLSMNNNQKNLDERQSWKNGPISTKIILKPSGDNLVGEDFSQTNDQLEGQITDGEHEKQQNPPQIAGSGPSKASTKIKAKSAALPIGTSYSNMTASSIGDDTGTGIPPPPPSPDFFAIQQQRAATISAIETTRKKDDDNVFKDIESLKKTKTKIEVEIPFANQID